MDLELKTALFSRLSAHADLLVSEGSSGPNTSRILEEIRIILESETWDEAEKKITALFTDKSED